MPFKPISISAKTRYISSISTFSGVDYATQKFKVNQNRAIDLLNFVYKDGVIQKRQGVEELVSINPTNYIPQPFDGSEALLTEDNFKTNTVNFNGIWTLTGEDNKLHIIAHIGKLLYEIKNFGTEEIDIMPISIKEVEENHNGTLYVYAYEFEDYKSSAFVGANRLYFLGGNKYMCMRFTLDENDNTIISFYPIEDHPNTYIPTTTTSITYENSAIGGRASLDAVNLLQQWRKNELISGTLKKEDENTKTEYFEYILDAPLIAKTDKDMKDILIVLNERGTIE